jgi:hypothetical protein
VLRRLASSPQTSIPHSPRQFLGSERGSSWWLQIPADSVLWMYGRVVTNVACVRFHPLATPGTLIDRPTVGSDGWASIAERILRSDRGFTIVNPCSPAEISGCGRMRPHVKDFD